MPAIVERRVDPADGLAYTYNELREFYIDSFSREEISAYWKAQCKLLQGARGKTTDEVRPPKAKSKAKAKAKARASSKREYRPKEETKEPPLDSFAAKVKKATRALPKSGKTIGTHSGTFQADEALGCWLLRQLPAYAHAAVVRSRDPDVLSGCDIVIDVGGVYDPASYKFDHHQRGFFETVDGEKGKASGPHEATGRWTTKLSSAGLVYKHFGREVIERLAGTNARDTELVWAEFYDSFMEALDGNDNGIEICEGKPKYKDSTNLPSRIARLNPQWNDKAGDSKSQDEAFERACALCGEDAMGVLGNIVDVWLPARALVEKALAERTKVHSSGRVIVLPLSSLPWHDHLYSLEREAGVPDSTRYALFVDQAGMWRIQAVTVEGTLFTSRLPLPETWRGLRDEALEAASGILGCCFVHATGFIGGHKTYEGVLAMATKALEDIEPGAAAANGAVPA
eukprot:TRINITY_DN75932_c0_g1_i1.p1 TRINITY_DN75932_c0_g1~~TRINITY_DN75932_c0_g1_i1.p1  ORF type:complete len:456 (+),score=74.08 TRINITY_DN75932_c0_g1_i1:80-1447(+)